MVPIEFDPPLVALDGDEESRWVWAMDEGRDSGAGAGLAPRSVDWVGLAATALVRAGLGRPAGEGLRAPVAFASGPIGAGEDLATVGDLEAESVAWPEASPLPKEMASWYAGHTRLAAGHAPRSAPRP